MARDVPTAAGKVSLYFAFPDGVFHYVCAECTALCCRGHGFAGSLQREMRQLLALHPALGSMAISRHGTVITVAAPSGRCHFLDDDNLCRIEKERGKALKPGVCTLFPFNNFSRIGKAIVVSPHFMCPLRLQLPARPGEVEGTHAFVEAAVRESALLDPAYLDAAAPLLRLHPSQDAESVLAREAGFRDGCALALGQRTFTETLRGESADAASLGAVVARAAQVMGLTVPPRSQPHDAVDDLLLALAPTLRLSALSLCPEGILRALALGELVLRRALRLSDSPPTLQGVHGILTAAGPALRLLARGDEPLELVRGAGEKVPPFGDPELTFAAFVALREARGATGTLGALEKAMTPSLTVADRSVLLRQLGIHVEQTCSPRPGRRDTARGSRRREPVDPFDTVGPRPRNTLTGR